MLFLSLIHIYATLATEEVYYDLEIPSEVAFKSQHIGYEDVFAQTVEIANAGNVEISNIKAVLAGEKKDVFTLETSGMKTTLAPGAVSYTHLYLRSVRGLER